MYIADSATQVLRIEQNLFSVGFRRLFVGQILRNIGEKIVIKYFAYSLQYGGVQTIFVENAVYVRSVA